MRIQFLLLAGSIILLSACGPNNKPSHDEIFIDSVANANVAKHDAENARKNDSIINAEAKMKAEATLNAQQSAVKKEENKPDSASVHTPLPGQKKDAGKH